MSTLTVIEAPAAARLVRPNPYLHWGDGEVYNPHTDQRLEQGDPDFVTLITWWRSGSEARPRTPSLEGLLESGFALTQDAEPDKAYRLKYVSLEAHTVCNQSCYFCPVSVAPRDDHFMPMDLYENIVEQVAALGEPIEAVFMISYNEPTADPRFLEQVECLKAAGLPPATLTNGSGLTPARADALAARGGLRFLSINLSTIDRERYAKERGKDHLPLVLRNLDYAKDKPVGEEMTIVVLGTGDEVHDRDFEQISERFEGTRFGIERHVVNDRAGYLPVGLKASEQPKLRGCDYMGSRPIQHVHINPHGECILCCQDYDEAIKLGDLKTTPLAEVLIGPEFVRARRMVYGLEEAPADYICRNCRFALKEGGGCS